MRCLRIVASDCAPIHRKRVRPLTKTKICATQHCRAATTSGRFPTKQAPPSDATSLPHSSLEHTGQIPSNETTLVTRQVLHRVGDRLNKCNRCSPVQTSSIRSTLNRNRIPATRFEGIRAHHSGSGKRLRCKHASVRPRPAYSNSCALPTFR